MHRARRAFRVAASFTVMVAGCAATTPPTTPMQSPEGAVRLKPMRTAFVRFFGAGELPKLTDTKIYELCIDLVSSQLVSVRSPGSEQQSDEQVANVLRGWKWSAVSSLPLKSGTTCWLERFSPTTDEHDEDKVVIESAKPLRHLLLIGDSDDLFEVSRPGSPEQTLAAFSMLENGPVRIVFLDPRLEITGSAGLIPFGDRSRMAKLKPILRPDPHLPDRYKILNVDSSATEVVKTCIDREGTIADIRPDVPIQGASGSIMRVLKTWRYEPLPKPVCVHNQWTFTISSGRF
jgi:hypothetical protein